MKPRVFLGHTFTSVIDNGTVHERYRDRITNIIKLFETNGHEVKCALVREKFGKELMNAEICTPLDYQEVGKCDVFICFPSNSGGVHIELGWASAMKKKIVLFLKEGKNYSPLVYGLSKLTQVELFNYRNEEDILEKIRLIINTSRKF